MEVKVKQADILELIGKTQNIVERKTTMPILSHILLEAKDDYLKVYVTDLEVSLMDQIKVDVVDEGKVVIDAKRLYQIIKELSEGSIHLSSTKNGHLQISQGKTEVQIVGVGLMEYPIFPINRPKKPFYINSSVFKGND